MRFLYSASDFVAFCHCASNIAPVVLIFSVVIYFHFMTDLKDAMKEKKRLIEIELPGFVRSILYKLDDVRDNSERTIVQVDLIQIFEDYLKVASDVFYYDVSVLVMEMKAKDIETALRNFNQRIGLTDVSFLVNALIGLYRGEHQGEALAYLARDMDVKAKEALRKKLNKLPGRIKVASIPLVVITLACLLYFTARSRRQSPGMSNPAIRSIRSGYGSRKADIIPIRQRTIQVQSGIIRFLRSVMAAHIIGTAQSSITISITCGGIIVIHTIHHINFKVPSSNPFG